MAKPNSLTTRVRDWLALRLEPKPDVGEAWCIGCAANDGRTLLTSADGMQRHISEDHGGAHIRAKIGWPCVHSGHDVE